jgi:hypothetical protein
MFCYQVHHVPITAQCLPWRAAELILWRQVGALRGFQHCFLLQRGMESVASAPVRLRAKDENLMNKFQDPRTNLVTTVAGSRFRDGALLPAAALVLLACGPGLAIAQNASSKASAAINTAVGCTVSNATSIGTAPLSCHDIFSGASVPVTPDNFVTIMSTPMKLSASQSLFASPSLVTGLYTSTTTKSHTGSTSTATASGGVYMRAVLTDPNTGAVVKIADPVAVCSNDILGCQSSSSGDFGVTLDSRIQTLTQTLSDCVVNVVVGGVAGSGTCDFDLTTQLILQTTAAHTFNFIFPNVGQGSYNIAIQVAVNSNATVGGSATAVGAAAFGLGSLTVESVRLVHNFAF